MSRPRVVDAHVHLHPGRLAEAVRGFFLAAGYDDFAYPLAHAEVLAALAAAGVDEVWHLPYAHKPGVAAGLNEASAATVAAGGAVAVVGGLTVHPADESPAAVVADAVDRLGLQVLKLHCSVGAFDADDARLAPVWALVEERRLPVVVHVGHDASGLTEGSELDPVGRVAERHPEAPIVVAHTAHPATRAALALLERHPGVHADLTPVLDAPVDVGAEDVERWADRLLFGSDAPNTAIAVEDGLGRLRAMPLSAGALAAVTGGTATRLLGARRR